MSTLLQVKPPAWEDYLVQNNTEKKPKLSQANPGVTLYPNE